MLERYLPFVSPSNVAFILMDQIALAQYSSVNVAASARPRYVSAGIAPVWQPL